MENIIHDILGIAGAALMVLAYFLVSAGRIKIDQPLYPLLNIIGAGLICFSLLYDWNLPSFIMEMFWIFISLFGLYKALRKKS